MTADADPFAETGPPVDGPFAPLSPILSAQWLIDSHGVDALKQPPPPRKWLLSRNDETRGTLGWLPLGVPALLYGAGGSGKSTAAVQLAMSVAAGRPWLGCRCNPGAVMIVMTEEDAAEIDRKLHAAYVALELSDLERATAAMRIMPISLLGHDAQILRAEKRGPLVETQIVADLRERLNRAPVDWRLIVLDNLSNLAPHEAEVDNGVAAQTMRVLSSLTRVRGEPTVLAVHHSLKTGRDGAPSINAARGAGALTDNSRWCAHLSETETGLVLACTKSNYSAKGPAIPLVRGHRGILRVATVEEAAERGLH